MHMFPPDILEGRKCTGELSHSKRVAWVKGSLSLIAVTKGCEVDCCVYELAHNQWSRKSPREVWEWRDIRRVQELYGNEDSSERSSEIESSDEDDSLPEEISWKGKEKGLPQPRIGPGYYSSNSKIRRPS